MMKNKKRSIRTKLLEVFFVVFAFAIVIDGFVYFRVGQMTRKMDDVYSSNLKFNECMNALDAVQGALYRYLNTKSSEALEDYYEYEQRYRDLIAEFNTQCVDEPICLTEKNVYYMSETWLEKANETIAAKRGRNITKYKEYYEDLEQNYYFLKANIDSMNNLAFTQNANEYEALKNAMHMQAVVSLSVCRMSCNGHICYLDHHNDTEHYEAAD